MCGNPRRHTLQHVNRYAAQPVIWSRSKLELAMDVISTKGRDFHSDIGDTDCDGRAFTTPHRNLQTANEGLGNICAP
jgi:hypothetical protein